MKIFDKDSIIFEYRCLFNGYPTVDEISAYCDPYDEPENIFNKDKVIIDDYYGRCFTGEYLNLVKCPYGENTRLPYYDHGGRMRLPIEGVLRVPYRKIPIHRICNLWEAQLFITQIIDYNPNYQILLRGQNKIYPTSRDKKDLEFLYGSEEVIEPSFLPSFSRKKLDYSSVVNAWHNLGDMLVNNLQKKGIEVSSDLEKWEAFHLFSLGIAQHYGLPSVGLDLTDNINVALWFALHNVKYDPYHPVEATPIDDKSDAYIFIFRSPRLTVFSYDNLNVTIGNERPVRQQAYFNYCGWGLAKNQLALNLAAVLKFNSSLLDYLPNAYTSYLFPNREQDPVLDTLLAIREKFKGTEFGNLLKDIYI